MKRKNSSELEDEIRRQVEQKFEERSGLLQHGVAYAIVNLMLWSIWLTSGAGFPWPLFVSGGWGIGLLSHMISYYNEHGPGARKREAAIEAAVERELDLARTREDLGRRRLSEVDEDDDADAAVYDLDNYRARGVRLSDDGELIDWPEEPDAERAERRH